VDHVFDRECVTIGRGEENHLTLSDPKRVVSTEHAAIRRTDEGYELVDRGSKNFTYVGETRLTAGQPYALSEGDVVRIGDFRIEFQRLERAPDPATGGETVFEADFRNPLAEPARRLGEALEALGTAYRAVEEQRRDDALADALDRHSREASVPAAVLPTVLEAFGAGAAEAKAEAGTEAAAGEREAEEEPTESSSAGAPASSGARLGDSADGVLRTVLDGLADAVARVVTIPWQFRHEFIGQTVMQSADTQFLYEGDGDAIAEHLLEPGLSPSERQARLDRVAAAAESVAVHQVAMLDGYKASVTAGSEALLDELDPDTYASAVQSGHWLFRQVPSLAAPAALERVTDEWTTLREEDAAVLETRLFRPPFTKAYLARMTAPEAAVEAPDED
jgi:predicted component of type VI protein secretion system